MKNLLFVSIFFYSAQILVAQPAEHKTFKPKDYEKALKSAVMNISADKYIAETKETVTLTVTIDMFDNDGNPSRFDYRPEDPATAPWFVTGWKIVEGGGTLVSHPTSGNDYYAVLTTPDKVPANKCVIVEVTLQSNDKQYPKTILRQSIYIEDHDNMFYVNCPALGINEEKWVVQLDNGVLQKMNNLPGGNAKQKEQVQKAMEQARKMSNGMNLDAATSNCKAVYAPEEDATAITITGNLVEMSNGKKVNMKKDFVIAISFRGKAPGTYAIKMDKKNNAAITVPGMRTGCACGDSPEDKAEREKAGEKGPTCNGGFIYIEKIENGFMTGTINANLEGALPPDAHVFYADIQGKFKVRVANF